MTVSSDRVQRPQDGAPPGWLRLGAPGVSSLQASALRIRIHVLGGISFAAHLVLAVLSYAQAPVLWQEPDSPQAAAFFARFGLPPQTFAGNETAILSYMVPMAAATVAAVWLVLLLTRHGEQADAAVVRLAFRWSVAFAAAGLLAFPVFTQDLWLSAAWGRMVAAGANPYHTLFTAEVVSGLPLDHFPMTMSYGPLWAAISALVALAAWNDAIVMGVMFKLLIAAAWVWALVLIGRLMRDRPVGDRCLAIVVFGWVPLSISQSVAEGHNDIVMMAPALLWFLLLLRNRGTAPAALAASALCKYTTAPLFLIDLIHAVRCARLGFREIVLRMVVPAAMAAVLLVLFFRSFAFFDGIRLVSEWHFLRPSEAVSGVEALIGWPLYPLHVVALAVGPVIAVYWLASAARDPTAETLTKAAIALLAGIMFGAISHLWPWYLIWGLAFAALLPRWWLSRFVIGVALLMPLALATWWIEPLEELRDVVTLVIYAGAALWAYLTRTKAAAAAMRQFSARDFSG